MNKLAFGAALAALSLALPGAAQAQRTPGAVIVVVDTDRVYRECTACRAAQTQLQGMVTSARTRASQLGQPLQTEAQSIEQAGAAAPQPDRRRPRRRRDRAQHAHPAVPDPPDHGPAGGRPARAEHPVDPGQRASPDQRAAQPDHHPGDERAPAPISRSTSTRPWPAPARSTSPTTCSPPSTRHCPRSASRRCRRAQPAQPQPQGR